jgi:hypothetical protein
VVYKQIHGSRLNDQDEIQQEMLEAERENPEPVTPNCHAKMKLC